MSLSGDVGAFGLEEVFAFLTANDLEGELTVRSSASAFRLYFREGRLFLPSSDREGLRSLSKVLEPDGVVARAWKGLLTELRKRSDRMRRISQAEQETRRKRYTEEVHSLFLWDQAHFEFAPGAWPASVVRDMQADRGVSLGPQAILFEVARRSDERQRIRRAIPSGRVILAIEEGADERVKKALAAVDVDLVETPIDGVKPLDHLLRRWLVPHYEVLAVIAELVEGAALQPLQADEARRRFRHLLDADDLPGAALLLEHLSELEATPPGQVLDLEPALVNSKAFRLGKQVVCNLRLDGPRIFALVRELLDAGTPFTLDLQHGGKGKRISLLPGVLTISASASDVPSLSSFLARISDKPLAEIEELLRTHGTLAGVISAPLLEAACLEKAIEELAELMLWGRADVELANRGVKSDAAHALILSLSPQVLTKVRRGLADWSSIFGDVPGDEAILVASSKCQRKDAASRFMGRFGPARNLGEMRRRTGAARLDFLRLVHRGFKNGYLLRPTQRVLAAWIEGVRERANHIMAFRFLRAAVAFGLEEEFSALLGSYRGKNLLPSLEPAIQGGLEGVGLPTVLQALCDKRHTGTLVVRSSDGAEERLYFDAGALVVLHRESRADEEFLELVLGEEGAETVTGLAQTEQVAEHEVDQALVQTLKARFLEVLFWRGASFAFYANDLPVDFFTPSSRVTKIGLRTQEFLLQAIRIMDDWDQVRVHLPGDDAVLRFHQGEDKLQAVQDHGEWAAALTLIDGRLSFGELLRRTGARRLPVGRVVADLIATGRLEVSGNGG